MTKMIDELVYMSRHVEILLYGDYRKRMNVRILTDSEPTLESIASTKQVERKALRMVVQEMKEKLRDGDISSYQWVSTKKHMGRWTHETNVNDRRYEKLT